MTISDLVIKRYASETFNINFFKEHIPSSKDQVIEIIKFLDDLVDVLMRYPVHMTVEPIDANSNLITVAAGV